MVFQIETFNPFSSPQVLCFVFRPTYNNLEPTGHRTCQNGAEDGILLPFRQVWELLIRHSVQSGHFQCANLSRPQGAAPADSQTELCDRVIGMGQAGRIRTPVRCCMDPTLEVP